MSDHPNVAIFWDYENCSPPSTSCGHDIVYNISRIARLFGSVTTFRAYLDISAQSSKSVVLRSELQSSGVSIIDCPHNGKKDVVDKMILVDMLAFAVDHPAPATIILITGDRDYAYAVSILKLRKYQVILIAPSSPHSSPSLETQASFVIDWGTAILRARTGPAHDLDTALTAKLLRELQDLSLDDPDPILSSYSSAYQGGASKLRRVSARDLLEPSKHSKNTSSFDSAQEFTYTPASPKKSAGTGNDSGPGGLSIPRTPSRSRCASVSTGSTRARSTTIVAQPPAVEQDHPVKSPPPSSASASDSADVSGPAKRSSSTLLPLDPFELPLHDNRPPSSIRIRSPLEPGQSADDLPVPEKSDVASSHHRLNHLASPFVMTKAPTELDSTVKPTSPIAVPTKTPSETITATCETPHIEDAQTVLPIGDLMRRAQEQAREAVGAPELNYHSRVASQTSYSPPSRNVGLHLTSTPAGNTVDAGDGVDSAQFADLSRASNTLDRAAPSFEPVVSSGATPFATTDSHEHDESERRKTRTMFKPLIQILLAARENGIVRPSRSTVAMDLVQSDSQVYKRAGVARFKEYTALAERAGVIELGGREATAWIALHPGWLDTTTNCLSGKAPSPTFVPPKAIQSPLLTDSETPLIQRTAIFPVPTPALSLGGSDTLTNSPSDRHDTRASIPVRFQPLIDVLVQMRVDGSGQILRSLVGQSLDRAVYADAGVSGFKEYVQQALEARLVQFGGVGGHAWISIHPELRM